MTDSKYQQLVSHLIEAANELFEDGDLGFPQTRDDFMRAMWQDDHDMKAWDATRDDYTHALHEAYAVLS